ncbi:MAG: hypothetical protein K9I85_14970 [Saprospiraceae bacterium]|nr:hypothetical protein [Saprospiraceae bacterium]
MSESIVLAISFFLLCFCAFFIIILMTWNKRSLRNQQRLHEMEKEGQRNLLKATIAGQELERKIIAENLHDDVGPLLSSLKLQVRNLRSDPEFQSSFLGTLDLAVGEIRRVLQRLSPLIFEELGLNEAIRHVCKEFIRLSGMTLDLDWDDDIQNQLSQDKKLAIFRILQEALNNSLKHSNAANVMIHARLSEPEQWVIEIEDDGRGIVQTSTDSLGLGMSSMIARAQSMNATLEITSRGKGTCLILTIPNG